MSAVGLAKPVTVGESLNRAMQQVEKSMTQLEDGLYDASDVMLPSAEKVSCLIASLKAAYENNLGDVCETSDSATKQVMARVNDLVTKIAGREKVADLSSRIEAVVKLSPIGNNSRLALLSSLSTRFIVMASNMNSTLIRVIFSGNFPYATNESCKPQLTLGDKTYDSLTNTKDSVQFIFPVAKDTHKLNADKCTLLRGTLSIPRYNAWYSFFPHVSKYETMVRFLPTSAGRIHVTYEDGEKTRVEKIATLGWGDSCSAKPEGQEKITGIVFHAFNGMRYTFQPKANYTNPFINLHEFGGGSIRILAMKENEIQNLGLKGVCRQSSRESSDSSDGKESKAESGKFAAIGA